MDNVQDLLSNISYIFGPDDPQIDLKFQSHLSNNIQSVLNKRSDYIKIFENSEYSSIKTDIGNDVSQYLKEFYDITNQLNQTPAFDIISPKQEPNAKEENELTYDFTKRILDYLGNFDSDILIEKMIIEPIIRNLLNENPSTNEEKSFFYQALFYAGSHYEDGIQYQLISILEIEKLPFEYQDILVPLSKSLIQKFSTFIQNNDFKQTLNPAKCLEISSRVIECALKKVKKDFKEIIISSALYSMSFFMHKYSYCVSEADEMLLFHIKRSIIDTIDKIDIEPIKIPIFHLIKLSPRYLYDSEFNKAVFPLISVSEKHIPQNIFGARYSSKKNSKVYLPLLKSFVICNEFFKLDGPLTDFIEDAFDVATKDIVANNPSGFLLLKELVKRIYCVKDSPRVCCAVIRKTSEVLDQIQKCFDDYKSFSGVYMLVLARCINTCLESLPDTPNEINYKSVFDSDLKLIGGRQFNLFRQKSPSLVPERTLSGRLNSISSISDSGFIKDFIAGADNANGKIYDFLCSTIPFIPKKEISNDIRTVEKRCAAAIINVMGMVDEFEKLANSEKKAITQDIKAIWRAVYSIRRTLIASQQRIKAGHFTSDIVDRFDEYCYEIIQKAYLFIDKSSIELICNEDDKLQTILRFLVSPLRSVDIKEVKNIKDERMNIRITALDFIVNNAPKISHDNEVFLIANISKPFIFSNASPDVLKKFENSIEAFQKVVFERGSKSLPDLACAYAIHGTIDVKTLLDIAIHTKNIVLADSAWTGIARFAFVYRDPAFREALIQFVSDTTITSFISNALMILNLIGEHPIKRPDLFILHSKAASTDSFINVAAKTESFDSEDPIAIIKQIEKMLVRIGESAINGSNYINVTDAMISFIRTSIQQGNKLRDTTLEILHKAIQQLPSVVVPMETVGAFVVLGCFGLSTTSMYSYDNGKLLNTKYRDVIPSARVVVNPSDFILDKKDAICIKKQLDIISQKINNGDVSSAVIMSALPYIFSVKENLDICPPITLAVLNSIGNNNCGVTERFKTVISRLSDKVQKPISSFNSNQLIIPLNCKLQNGIITPITNEAIIILNEKISISSVQKIKAVSENMVKANFSFGYVDPTKLSFTVYGKMHRSVSSISFIQNGLHIIETNMNGFIAKEGSCIAISCDAPFVVQKEKTKAPRYTKCDIETPNVVIDKSDILRGH